jgi:hypothetical protein
MEVEVDVDWPTVGATVLVDTLVLLGERQWRPKIHGCHIHLRGRMLFVLTLSRHVLPGMTGAQLYHQHE